MKIIKSFLSIALLLGGAVTVQAQAETKKMADRPVPQSSMPPVQTPDMPNAPKPVAAAPVTEEPLPAARDKNQPQAATEKPNLKVIENIEPETPGGEEGKKIMAGKSTNPAPEINSPSTIDPKGPPPMPKTVKPANGRQPQ